MKTLLLLVVFAAGCATQPAVETPKPPPKKPTVIQFIDILEQVQS